MCIAIYLPPDAKPLDPKLYFNCADVNEDGAGFAVSTPQGMVVKKGFMKPEELLVAMKPYEGMEAIVHFRRASPQMDVSQAMCHPFEWDTSGIYDLEAEAVVADEVGTDSVVADGEAAAEIEEIELTPRFRFAIIHNGKLPWRDTGKESDTCLFVRELLGPVLAQSPWMLDTAHGRFLIEHFITLRNKLVIMRYDYEDMASKVYILNEKEGHRAHGNCWFSNYSYVERVVAGDWRDGGDDDFLYRHGFYGSAAQSARTLAPGMIPTDPALPDYKGWKWDWAKDSWVNERSGRTTFYLNHRPNSPVYAERQKHKTPSVHTPVNGPQPVVAGQSTPPALPHCSGSSSAPDASRAVMATMAHLGTKERAYLCSHALDWYRKQFPKMGNWSLVGAIRALRDEIQYLFNDKVKSDTEADLWVIGLWREGKDLSLQLQWAREAIVRTHTANGGSLVRGVIPLPNATHLAAQGELAVVRPGAGLVDNWGRAIEVPRDSAVVDGN